MASEQDKDKEINSTTSTSASIAEGAKKVASNVVAKATDNTDINSNTDKSNNSNYGSYVDLFNQYYIKPTSYEDDERRARRTQKAALWGDIAQVISQGITAEAGQRKFQPIKFNTPDAESAYQKVRDARSAANLNYSNKALDAAYKDITLRRQEQLDKEKQEKELRASNLAQDKLEIERNKQRMYELKLQMTGENDQARLKLMQDELDEKIRRNQALEGLRSSSNAISRMNAYNNERRTNYTISGGAKGNNAEYEETTTTEKQTPIGKETTKTTKVKRKIDEGGKTRKKGSALVRRTKK